MEGNLKIRRATANDGEAIARLFMRVWRISLKEFVPEGFLEQFQHDIQKQKYAARAADPEWLLFVAESGFRIVGMIGAKENDSEPLLYKKQIKSMYVDPNFQSQGIGAALLDRIFLELRGMEVGNVMLWCIKSNERAARFYEKHGGKRIENVKTPAEYAAMPHVIYAWDCLN
jgi:GNAT superfamily N-acetyltransferase